MGSSYNRYGIPDRVLEKESSKKFPDGLIGRREFGIRDVFQLGKIISAAVLILEEETE